MPRTFAALDLLWSAAPDDDAVDVALAHLDDCGATAVERTALGARLFFLSPEARDRALPDARALDGVRAEPIAVPDEGWAERSQASITAVRVGRIVVTPPWVTPPAAADDIVLIIQPSMGFGTGHHASTRLCLALLQTLALTGLTVLDVGTGSGVLALAAVRLGAAGATGIDYDPDALTSADENIALNRAGDAVTTAVVDIARDDAAAAADVITANLTGGMLTKYAPRLLALIRPGGRAIVSGFQIAERDEVLAALQRGGAVLVDERTEDSWVAALLRTPA
jgi:ribosomal protein L11 methyltransferase